jgi:peroxiredoxin
VSMTSSVFWDKTPCSPLKVNRSLGKKLCRLHLQCRRINQVIIQRGTGSKQSRKFLAFSLPSAFTPVSCSV